VLVVGGGDSAVEAACSVAEEADTRVTLAYRGQAFARVKPRNRSRLDALVAQGGLTLSLNTEVARIEDATVHLKVEGQERSLPNDAVIVCAGGELPMPLLQSMGVMFETKHGTA
jgi:thioredoxin reductase